MQVLFPVLFLGVMWALLIRPQQQRARKQRELVASLEVGDRVVTAGGLVARVVGLSDAEATLEAAPGVTMTFLRAAINRKLDGEEGAA